MRIGTEGLRAENARTATDANERVQIARQTRTKRTEGRLDSLPLSRIIVMIDRYRDIR